MNRPRSALNTSALSVTRKVAGPRLLGRRPPAATEPSAAVDPPRPPAPQILYDAHAGSLLSLAVLVIDDPGAAEGIVGDVLRAACVLQRACDDRVERRDLARDTYDRCLLVAGRRTPVRRRTPALPGGLTRLSDEQVAVIALSLFGGHSHSETAELLCLPVDAVDEMMRTGLHRLVEP